MSQEKRANFNAQIAEEAAEWFVEFRLGDIDAAGRRDFDTWIRTSPEHLRAYLETAALWNEGGSLGAHRNLDSDALIALARTEGNIIPLDSERSQSPLSARQVVAPPAPSPSPGKRLVPQPRIMPRWLVSLAAALAIVVIGAAATLLWQFGRDAVYATAAGERRVLRLEDGSTVELNSRSRIRVQFAQNQRNVELLEGQVLFHVAKDVQRPFVVRSDELRVRAIGTQFDVNRKSAGTTVTVVEGRVAVYRAETPVPDTAPSYISPPQPPGPKAPNVRPRLQSSSNNSMAGTTPAASLSTENPATGTNIPDSAGSAAIFLSAGDQLTLNDQTPKPLPQRADPSVATAWTQGQLILDSTTLTDAAEEFNRYSTRRLIVEDHGEPPLRLSGVFATDPDFLLHYLRQRPDITVQETQSEVRIIRHD